MKMTKIESARFVYKQKGNCFSILCAKCFTTRDKCGCKELKKSNWDERKLQLATTYIKRHEGKSRKKATPNVDTVCSEGELPKVKPDEYIDIPKTPVYTTDPTPLDIAKMIRDNNYKCRINYPCELCPIRPCKGNKRQLIDSYISANEPFGNPDKPVIPEPIIPTPLTIEELRACMKIDMWIYYFNDKVARINLKNIHTISASRSEISLISTAEMANATDYYKTLDEAIIVAKSKWQVGK